jgi:hypothetical protein
MMKKIFLFTLLNVSVIVAYGQKNKKNQPSNDAAANTTSMLTESQRAELKQVNKKFSEDMKALINTPSNDPLAKRRQIEVLRAKRDSTLKAKLGDQLFSEYRSKAVRKAG